MVLLEKLVPFKRSQVDRGDGLVPTQWKENKSPLHTCTVTCNHALTYNACMST